jgi:hypothetical protein
VGVGLSCHSTPATEQSEGAVRHERGQAKSSRDRSGGEESRTNRCYIAIIITLSQIINYIPIPVLVAILLNICIILT